MNVGKAADETAAAIARLVEEIASEEEPIEGRCDFSYLLPSQCAHCNGHVADWEMKRKESVYDGA